MPSDGDRGGGPLDRERVAAELRRFLERILKAGRFDLRFAVEFPQHSSPDDEIEAPDVVVTFDGRDRDLLLERGAELLKALEYVAVRAARMSPATYDRVRFDCGDYRAMRVAELKLSAEIAAERVRTTRQAFRFNPMPARERRVIHLALRSQPGVRTASEGEGEERGVVVFPADTKQSPKS